MLKFLITALNYLTTGVCVIVEGTISCLYSVLTINYLLIDTLHNLCFRMLNYALNLCLSFLFGLQCSVRDFSSFIYDIVDLSFVITSTAKGGVINLYSSCVAVFSAFLDLIASILQTFFYLWNSFLSLLLTAGSGVINFTSLIGRSIAILVKLIPATIVVFITACKYALQWIVYSQTWLLQKVINITGRAFFIATNQTFEFYLGIVTSILLYYAFKRRFVLKRCLKLLIRVLCRHIRTLMPFLSSLLIIFPQRSINRVPGAAQTPPEPRADENDNGNYEGEEEIIIHAPTPSTSDLVKNRRQTEVKGTVSELTEELERLRENQLCVICQDAERCIILLPCRHLCLCQPCLRTMFMHQVRCPVCRALVRDSLKVYS